MMSRTNVVFLVFILLGQVALAKDSNFVNGYIINLQMDTVFGQLRNGSYIKNSQECHFKSMSDDTFKTYKPEDINAYRFLNGKYYVSKFIPEQKQTVFLEYLIKGSLDVFFQQISVNDNRFYISKDTLPLRFLKYSDEPIYIGDKRYIRSVHLSEDILKFYTQDCPSMIPLIEKLGGPSQRKMIQFATTYHDKVCSEGHCQVFEKKIPTSVYVASSIGFGNSYRVPSFTYEELIFSNSRNLPNSWSVYVQQSWISESIYMGIGYSDFSRIPVSINHIPEGKGILPMLGYEIDVNTFFKSQNLIVGLRIPYQKWSFTLTGNLSTLWYLFPYASTLRAGLMYQLR